MEKIFPMELQIRLRSRLAFTTVVLYANVQ